MWKVVEMDGQNSVAHVQAELKNDTPTLHSDSCRIHTTKSVHDSSIKSPRLATCTLHLSSWNVGVYFVVITVLYLL